MGSAMTLEEAIAEVRRPYGAWTRWTPDDVASLTRDKDLTAVATILNAVASGDLIPLAEHKPVAWRYRWKIDGEYVGWRYSDASNAHPLLDGFEEVPLYEAPPDHKLAVALVVQKAVEACQGMDPEGDILALQPKAAT